MLAMRSDDVEWGSVSGHRSGRIEFKRLLQGQEGTPGNFELSLVRSGGDYFTPRHRHNFDQIRYCLQGSMNYAPSKDLEPGDVGYFPEGTYYGPQTASAESIVLLLQFGGASGQGFMSYAQLNAGFEELRSRGDFDRGTFAYRDDQGVARRKDGYEAVWEHVNRRPVAYPK